MDVVHYLYQDPKGKVRASDPEKKEMPGQWVNASDGIWRKVRAESYDPAVHGDKLRCGDHKCDAIMHPQHNKSGFAGSGTRKSRFYSEEIDAHRKGCTKHKIYKIRHNTVTFNRASVDPKTRIIATVNTDVGHPDFEMFGDSVKPDKQKTPYNYFRKKYPHATLTSSSIPQLRKTFARLEKKDEDVLARAVIAHAQDIREYDHVMVRDNAWKMRRMIASTALKDAPLAPSWKKKLHTSLTMEDGDIFRVFRAVAESFKRDIRPDHIIHGFPRRIFWHANEKETANLYVSAPRVAGAPNLLLRDKQSRHVLLSVDVLHLDDPAMRPEILHWSESDLIAVPAFSNGAFREAWEAYAGGKQEVSVLEVNWRVISRDQYVPVEGAVEYPAEPPEQREMGLVT